MRERRPSEGKPVAGRHPSFGGGPPPGRTLSGNPCRSPNQRLYLITPFIPPPPCPSEDGAQSGKRRVAAVQSVHPAPPCRPGAQDPHPFQFPDFTDHSLDIDSCMPGDEARVQWFLRVPEEEGERPEKSPRGEKSVHTAYSCKRKARLGDAEYVPVFHTRNQWGGSLGD